MKPLNLLLLTLISILAIQVNAQTPPSIFISGSGQVGINTTSLTQQLTVNGNVQATSFIGNGSQLTGINGLSQWITNSSNIYYLTGNVGIGTSSPAEVLELNGNIRGNISGGALQINTANLISSGANAYAQIGPQNGSFCHFYTNTPSFAINEPITMIYSAPICAYVSSQGTAYNLQFNTNNTERMVILGNGYVGIGVTSPAFMLDLGTGSNAIIRSSNVSITSDSTLKKNIQNLKGARASLLKLRGVTYQFKSNTSVITANNLSFPEDPSINPDSSKNKLPTIDTANMNRTHIGFLAQEVQKIYPELVYTDQNGILSLDYIGLIPVLVETIKELTSQTSSDSLNLAILNQRIIRDSIYYQSQLQTILNQLNICCGSTKQKSAATATIVSNESDQLSTIDRKSATIDNLSNVQVSNVSALYQNSPNPFNLSTTIGYFLASNVNEATIYIYNMVGTQLKSISLYGTGGGNININGNELSAGMYLYALVVDGKIIDTKKMILTN